MPKQRTDAGPSNYDPSEEEPSAGTSSSVSDSKPEKSGDSPQATESSPPPPAPSAENLSSPVRKAQAPPRSTASSTGGSTRGTGKSQ